MDVKPGQRVKGRNPSVEGIVISVVEPLHGEKFVVIRDDSKGSHMRDVSKIELVAA